MVINIKVSGEAGSRIVELIPSPTWQLCFGQIKKAALGRFAVVFSGRYQTYQSPSRLRRGRFSLTGQGFVVVRSDVFAPTAVFVLFGLEISDSSFDGLFFRRDGSSGAKRQTAVGEAFNLLGYTRSSLYDLEAIH